MSDDKKAIEHIAESLKSYFSIAGVIIIGLYMIHNAESAGFAVKLWNYIGGVLAMFMGSIIGVWYSFHLFSKLMAGTEGKSLSIAQSLFYGGFVLVAFILICTIILGSVTSSCGVIFQ